MAGDENQDRIPKLFASRAQETEDPKQVVTVDEQQIGTPVRAAQNDPENEAGIEPVASHLRIWSSRGKEIIPEETPENAKSESDIVMESLANVQVSGFGVDNPGNLLPPKTTSSSKKPPLIPNYNVPAATDARMAPIMPPNYEDKTFHEDVLPPPPPPRVARYSFPPGEGAAYEILMRKARETSRRDLSAMILMALLRQMPMVTTNGGIPDAPITEGFLYKYRGGATIVCACHGRFFTSAEFLEHAGGAQVEQPSRLIHLVFFPS